MRALSKVDVATAALIALSLPSYYKIRFLLDGVMTWDDLATPGVWIEYLFSTLLGFSLVALHAFFAERRGLQFLIVAAASAAAACVFTWFFYRFVAPWDASRGFLFDIAILAGLTPLLLSGVRDRMTLAKRAFVLEARAAAAERASLVAQFDALKARLSPHFLFNGLSTLSDLVEEDPALAVRFIDQLATVYRYILEHQDAALVGLDDEITAARAFLFVLETRHAGALDVNAPQPHEGAGFHTPPLALQTLVENALKHNAYSPAHPLKLSIEIERDCLRIENTLRPRPSSSLNTGLSSLARRLAVITERPLEYGEADGLFWVKLPLLRAESLCGS